MSGLNLSRFAGIALLAVLGMQNMVRGQSLATPQFHPLTDADVQAVLIPVQAAAIALEQRFATAGASAAGWKAYLGWDQFKAELQKASPDAKVLDEVYDDLCSGNEGLELKCFADLRTALGNYRPVAAYTGKPELEAAFKSEVDKLQQLIKSASNPATTDETHKIAENLHWLETLRQAPELVREVRRRFSQPNFHVQIGSDLLAAGVGGPIDDVAPIDDVILNTVVHGTGHTVGQTKAALEPTADFAVFDAVLAAVNTSNNVGRNGPVCIYSTGETWLSADKRFWIDAAGLHAHPAQAAAEVHTTINDIVSIKGRRFVEKIAWRRAGKQLGEAEAIAGQHAAGRLSARVDLQADPLLQKANENFEVKLRKPLEERRAFSQALSFDTIAGALEIHGTQALGSQLAAPSPPPVLTRSADVTIRVHESTINNFVETIFTGMQITDDMVTRASVQMPEEMRKKLRPDQDPFAIVFPPENTGLLPVTTSFVENGFVVTVRGWKYYTGEKLQEQPGMYITARYQFKNTPDGSGTAYSWSAIRQGDLDIYGKKPGLSARMIMIKNKLLRRFSEIFEPEIKLQGIKFNSGKLAALGQLAPGEIIARDGWLAVGYNRVKASGPATAAN
jgi:hypothetical protein